MVDLKDIATATAEAWVQAKKIAYVHGGMNPQAAELQAIREFQQKFPSFGLQRNP